MFLEVVGRTGNFPLLNGRRRVDAFRANFGTGTDETALPDTVIAADPFFAIPKTGISGINVVTVGQG